jgi:hypothetical protein
MNYLKPMVTIYEGPMTPIYLSADTPRWTPRTEADLQTGIDQGLLGESHYLDLKAVPTARGENKEAARDLVSFSIDGGTLIYGIAEDKINRIFIRSPQPLNGLAEKIENIALSSLVDPPLHIRSEEIPTDVDRAIGYLVVHIPASPVAPHMADGRYYGRNDKTKYALSDPEVLRLHERRRSDELDALALLSAEIASDPIPAELRQKAHLFLVAQPLAGRRDMLLDLVSAPDWNLNLRRFTEHAYTPELDALLSHTACQPSLRYAGNGYRRARGAAQATPNLGNGRQFTPAANDATAEDAIEVQVHEDGGMRLFFSSFSQTYPAHVLRPVAENLIHDGAAVDCTRRFLALVRAAAERAGYFGNWALAFGATGLKGMRAHGVDRDKYFSPDAAIEVDNYAQSTTATYAELTTAPGAPTRRLVGPLLRALATEERYATIFADQTP